MHLVAHGFTWLHLVGGRGRGGGGGCKVVARWLLGGCTWLHMVALGCIWLHLVALGWREGEEEGRRRWLLGGC